ncbi:hypothetical protein GWI33_003503, partial [Rhynchophorus ferrugineus]
MESLRKNKQDKGQNREYS